MLKDSYIGEKTPKGKVWSQINFIFISYFSFVAILHSSPGGNVISKPVILLNVSSIIILKNKSIKIY